MSVSRILSKIFNFFSKKSNKKIPPYFDLSRVTANNLTIAIDYYAELSSDKSEIEQLFAQNNNNFLPICQDSKDEVIGYYHISDLALKQMKIRQDILLISSYTEVLYLLPMSINYSMFIVSDEFGATKGFITKDSLLSSIFLHLMKSKKIIYLNSNMIIVNKNIAKQELDIFINLPDTLSNYLNYENKIIDMTAISDEYYLIRKNAHTIKNDTDY